jgi:hypothetical protein
MAIAYPRELPHYLLEECSFRLVEAVTSVTSHSGAKINMTMMSDPIWTLDVTTLPMWDDERREWTAWKNSLRGGLRSFVAYDATRNPGAYPLASSPGQISTEWDGTATVANLGLSGQLGLSGLPSGYRASVGDRVSLHQPNGSIGYYEVLEDAVASGGGAITLSVSPLLHTTIFTTAATARLWQARAKFVIDWQSWQESTVGGPSSISFRAVQRVMA